MRLLRHNLYRLSLIMITCSEFVNLYMYNVKEKPLDTFGFELRSLKKNADSAVSKQLLH